jgi:short-subunit dehydrogenase
VTVTTVCPGFTKTEFHQRMGVRRGTGFLWMEPDFVVGRALADFDRGRVISVPGAQYRAIVTATRLVPSRALQAYQSIGRR